jgi:uncharacterized protein
MSNFSIVALYIGLNAILLLILAYNVGSRRGAQNALEPGASGDATLTRAIRAQGNFAEYAPTVMLLLFALSMIGYDAVALHLFGGSFTVGRVLHAIGMMRRTHPNTVRFLGNLLTGLALLLGGGACIAHFVAEGRLW